MSCCWGCGNHGFGIACAIADVVNADAQHPYPPAVFQACPPAVNAPIRSTVRAAGQVVVTNPDMLHSAILPHHTKWFQLFEQLQLIVVDELHTYRGILGAHVSAVLRRLMRICEHYGSKPVFLAASATIANPGELASRLIGRDVEVIDDDG